MFETIVRCPDIVIVDQTRAMKNETSGSLFTAGDVTVETQVSGGKLNVSVTAADTSVCKVRLRWHLSQKLRGQVLGDAWERAYGVLEWKNVTPWQTLPWYALVNDGKTTVGYGVMVRPGAICNW